MGKVKAGAAVTVSPLVYACFMLCRDRRGFDSPVDPFQFCGMRLAVTIAGRFLKPERGIGMDRSRRSVVILAVLALLTPLAAMAGRAGHHAPRGWHLASVGRPGHGRHVAVTISGKVGEGHGGVMAVSCSSGGGLDVMTAFPGADMFRYVRNGVVKPDVPVVDTRISFDGSNKRTQAYWRIFPTGRVFSGGIHPAHSGTLLKRMAHHKRMRVGIVAEDGAHRAVTFSLNGFSGVMKNLSGHCNAGPTTGAPKARRSH